MRALVAALLIGLTALTWAESTPRLAIIIDDLGYHRARGEAISNLPADITYAVIPQAPWAAKLAEHAASNGKEVILHLPMETGERPLDAGGLDSHMQQAELVTTVREAFIRIPQARGANNHMGSILTAHEPTMRWLMQELAMNHYFFIDSRTTPDTVAEKVAQKYGLRTAGRDIFLDNERDLEAINTQFNKALALARKRGQAIAIGHPYPETIHYLENVLPLMSLTGIEIVPVSSLLPRAAITTARQEDASQHARISDPDA